MNSIPKRYYIILIIIFSGCGSFSSQENIIAQKEKATVFEQFPEETHLQEKKYMQVDDVEGQRMLLYQDSILLMQKQPSKSSPYHFSLFNLNNKSFVSHALAYGRFPDEVMGFISCGTANDSLWAYDIIKEHIVILSLKDVVSGKEVAVKKVPMPTFYYSIQLVNNKKMIASGDYGSDYRIAEIDISTGNIEKQFGSYTMNPYTYAQKKAYESRLLVKPSGDKAVLATRFADRVQFFDLETGTNKVVKGPENYDPEMVLMKRGDGKEISAPGPDTRYGFVKGKATDNFIYLLYSGHSHNSEHFIYGKNIYVYDWEGNPVKKIILEKEVVNFVVTGNDEKIYTYNPKTKYIMMANLKQR